MSTTTPEPAPTTTAAPAAPASPSDQAELTKTEKIVASLTPLFAIIAGYISTVVARYFPGVTIPKGQIIWAFVVGASAVVFIALKWLHSHDQRLQALLANAEAAVSSTVAQIPGGQLVEADIVKLIEDHLSPVRSDVASVQQGVESQIEAKVPASVAAALQNVFSHVDVASLVPDKPAS